MNTSATVSLIGGAPGAGKTTLARALGIRLGVPSLTGDDILIAVRGVTTPQSHPDLHRIGTAGHTIYFTESTPESLMQDSLAQHEAVWPAFERVARKRARFGQPTVIDYWGLLPERMAEFGDENVESFWLHIDPDILRARELQNEDFLIGSSDPERMFENFMSRSLWWNEKIHTEATALGLPILHQDGTKSVDSLVDEVLGVC